MTRKNEENAEKSYALTKAENERDKAIQDAKALREESRRQLRKKRELEEKLETISDYVGPCFRALNDLVSLVAPESDFEPLSTKTHHPATIQQEVNKRLSYIKENLERLSAGQVYEGLEEGTLTGILQKFPKYRECEILDDGGNVDIPATLEELAKYTSNLADTLLPLLQGKNKELETQVGTLTTDVEELRAKLQTADEYRAEVERCYKATEPSKSVYNLGDKKMSEEELFALGVKNREEKKYTPAIDAFIRIKGINPKHVEARVNLGMVFRDMGKKDMALQYFNEALELDPNHKFAQKNVERLTQ